MVNNYVRGRGRENARLEKLRRKKKVIIGGRFRGSKISNGWIKRIGFNPKIDLWYLDENQILHFEQLKSAGKGNKAYIGKNEIESIQRFANIFNNSSWIWVGYVLQNYRKEAQEVRLN
jgi:hypothetical protein